MNKVLVSLLIASVSSLGVAYAKVPPKPIAANVIKVHSQYARAVPPGQPNGAVFMTLVNTTSTPWSVKSASSPAAKVTELHITQNHNGVMQMHQVSKIDLPAAGEVVLKPGSLHMMLIGLKQDLKVGEKTSVTLTFSDNSQLKLDVPIQEVTQPMNNNHSGHSEHHMH
ncbi:copper chaperone PCu(A)C [Thiofilum flexile]|uniref:copper chaperone PCu(A)C n=1 Tax=Thiofilum flexile TaxID=125627 RepID=UPI00036CED3D|nr:copper chaperone PCu(A)C [Thiofilum flexile]